MIFLPFIRYLCVKSSFSLQKDNHEFSMDSDLETRTFSSHYYMRYSLFFKISNSSTSKTLATLPSLKPISFAFVLGQTISGTFSTPKTIDDVLSPFFL